MQTTIQTQVRFEHPADENRMRKLILRDIRVMNRILGIFRYEEGTGRLFSQTKSGKWKVSRKEIAELLLSTRTRPVVPYDLKQQFKTISHNEIMECADQAAEMYKAYLRTRSKGKAASHPVVTTITSRRIGYRRFRIDRNRQIISVIDSRDSNVRLITSGKVTVHHDYLDSVYSHHKRLGDYLCLGTPKSLVIKTRKKGEMAYYAHITFDVNIAPWQDSIKPLAVLGIDLGIAKTATTVVLTKHGIEKRRVFNDNASKKRYDRVDTQIQKLQRELHLRSVRVYRNNLRYYRSKITNPAIRQGISKILTLLYLQVPSQTACSRLEKVLQSLPKRDRYEDRLLQRVIELKDQGDKRTKGLVNRLRKLKRKRLLIKTNMIRQLCVQLQDYIYSIRKDYQLYISLGDITGIRNAARRGNGMPGLRKQVNFWAFHKFSVQLEHNMAKIGMYKRLITVREAWTSIMCYRCNTKGDRKRQSIFRCTNPACDLRQINADYNGAANIAKRGLLYKKLVSKTEMIHDWMIPKRAIKIRVTA